MSESLDQRRRALEDAFFADQDRKLIERMRESERAASRRAALAAAAGVNDGAVLDRLDALGLAPETLAALYLVPVVLVAWADGEIDERERAAVLRAAEAGAVPADSPAHALLAGWLTHRPPTALFDTWAGYTRAVAGELAPAQRDALRAEVLGRARTVAEAAGGFLGLGRRVSDAEAAMLTRLEGAFAA